MMILVKFVWIFWKVWDWMLIVKFFVMVDIVFGEWIEVLVKLKVLEVMMFCEIFEE